jgi:hypothetical protein
MRVGRMATTAFLSAAIGIGAGSCKRTPAGQQSAPVTGDPKSSGAAVPAPTLIELTASDRALGKAATIPDDVLRSAKAQGKNLRRLEGRSDDDEAVPAAGLTIDVDRHHALNVVRSLRSSVGPHYFVFISEQNFGVGGQLDNVSILKAADAYEAMRVMGTNADNYEMTRAALIAQLKSWDSAYGLRFRGVGFDWVEAEFTRQPSDMLSFAKQVYKFCPDVVDQGAGTVEKLAAEMARTNALYLWWD